MPDKNPVGRPREPKQGKWMWIPGRVLAPVLALIALHRGACVAEEKDAVEKARTAEE